MVTSIKKKDKASAMIFAIVFIIIAVVIVGYLVWTFSQGEKTIAIGDCADVEYIGRFAGNGTIFTSTYNDSENETGGVPVKLFINPNMTLSLPDGYELYTSAPKYVPQGAIRALIGMKEGERKNITLTPEEAFGIWDTTLAEHYHLGIYPLNSVINTTISDIPVSSFSEVFPNVNTTVNTTFDYGAIILQKENVLSAEIIKITEDGNLTFKLLPENGTTFILPTFNWTVTFLVTNDTMFTIHSEIQLNHTFSFQDSYQQITYYCKVVSINITSATLAVNIKAPSIEFVDQSLIFEFKVITIAKTSQNKS